MPNQPQPHQTFYDIHGDDPVSDRLAGITHEEYFQHIKARLYQEAAEDGLQGIMEFLGLESTATDTAKTSSLA